MDDKKKEIINNIVNLVPKLDEKERERLLGVSEGMLLMKSIKNEQKEKIATK